MKTELRKTLESKFDILDEKIQLLELLLLNNITDQNREIVINKLSEIFNNNDLHIMQNDKSISIGRFKIDNSTFS